MTSIEEKLIGRISGQLTRAVEEADQAYEFAPSSYTAGALNALLYAQRLPMTTSNATASIATRLRLQFGRRWRLALWKSLNVAAPVTPSLGQRISFAKNKKPVAENAKS
jgi:hypothetical protein